MVKSFLLYLKLFKMIYKQVIVSYDIEDTKIRSKLRKDLMGLGLVPVQKSVMWGYLNKAEEKAVKNLLSLTKIDKTTDAMFLAYADLEGAVKQGTTYGLKPTLFEHPDEDKII